MSGDRILGERTASVVEELISASDAAAVRSELQRNEYQTYRLLDRGCFDYQDLDTNGSCGPICTKLAAYVSSNSNRQLRIVTARAIRLRAGHYTLANLDAYHDDLPLQLTVDCSEHAVTNAHLFYRRRGGVFFFLPSQPRSAAIVERGPSVNCHHSYISKRFPNAEIIRLVLLLRDHIV
jgi:hypothetical protein